MRKVQHLSLLWLAVLLAGVALSPNSACATIIQFDAYDISLSTGVTLSKGARGAPDGSVTLGNFDGIQTKLLPMALAWRIPTGARVWVSMEPEVSSQSVVEVWIRYSTDGRHWSGWSTLSRTPVPLGINAFGSTFGTDIYIPHRDSAPYDERLEEWQRSSRSNDEDIFCRWLLKKEPLFFEKNSPPRIGYLQVLIENWSASAVLKRVRVSASWAVSGLVSSPISPEQENRRWHFSGTP